MIHLSYSPPILVSFLITGTNINKISNLKITYLITGTNIHKISNLTYPRVVMVTMVYQNAAGIDVKFVSCSFFSA